MVRIRESLKAGPVAPVWALLTGLVLAFAQPAVAQSGGTAPVQPSAGAVKFAVDHAVDKCIGPRSKHGVLYYSRLGVHYCAVALNKRAATNEARRRCKKLLKGEWRKKAPCQLLSIDGTVEDPGLLSRLRKGVSVPFDLIVLDGDTGAKQTIPAKFAVVGAKNKDEVLFAIRNEGGAPLCNGSYELLRGKVRLNMRCFNLYRFSDKRVKHKGYVLQNGAYAPVFDAKLEYNQSYIEISLPDPS